jgi:hypothetical protein
MARMTAFEILRERCGLSAAEAAAFLGVSRDVVEAWSSGRMPVGHPVIIELRALYRKIVHTGRELGETLRIRLEQQTDRHVAIALADGDDEARAYGFP